MTPRDLANIYLRQAGRLANSEKYLTDLIEARLATLEAQQGGTINSTSVNGKSVTYSKGAGSSIEDQLQAAQMALSAFERGLDYIPSKTMAVFS